MAATVLTGTLVQGTTFSYTNNTGGNVRFMIYYMHTGWTDGNSPAGTFGWGAASGNGQMEMDIFEGTQIGKYIANAATQGSSVHGYAHSSSVPVEFMLADNHIVWWNPPNYNWVKAPHYNFLVIPETEAS